MPYELELKINVDAVNSLIENFVFDTTFSPVKCSALKEFFASYVNAVVSEIIGSYLAEETITEIKNKNNEIALEILRRLNEAVGRINCCGFIAKSFTFLISEDFQHRQEKQRVEHDEFLRGIMSKKE